MAKRFHDSEVWSQDWFIGMPSEYKMLWFWVKDKCSHAGIWKPNKKTFEVMCEVKVDLDIALNLFNSEKTRIVITQKQNWFIVDFFFFQYGYTFNISNKVHKSIYEIYYQENIDLRSLRGLKEVKLDSFSGLIEEYVGLKDKEKDKDILGVLKGGISESSGQNGVEKTSMQKLLQQ